MRTIIAMYLAILLLGGLSLGLAAYEQFILYHAFLTQY